MNIIDFLLLLIIVASAVSGWRRGFIREFLQLFMLAGGLVIAFLSYPYVAKLLGEMFPAVGLWQMPVAFLIVLLIARAILWFIARKFLQTTPERAHESDFNKTLGIFPGLINGLIWAILLSALFFAIPLWKGLSNAMRESKYADKLAEPVEWLNDRLSPVFDDLVNRSINRITIDSEAEKSIDLHFTVKNAKPRPDLEAEMLQLINEEREKENLPPLVANEPLREVARTHSDDMFERGYFSHVSPEGVTPDERVRKAKIGFVTTGENLALAQTLSMAHNGLMKSPGHRANILNPSYGRVGIGILDGGVHGLMITQEFKN